jgi:hypothetical protein
MTLRADSYSSVADVTAFTRHLLRGESAYSFTTRPTITEVERFIDRYSGVLNVAIAERGFAPVAVRSNSTAKLLCDDWVATQAARSVELTQRGAGYSDAEGTRTQVFSNIYKSAQEFVDANKLGLQRLGIQQQNKLSDGLTFTGIDAQQDRTDPQDTSLEQPFFRRGQFDFPKSTEGTQVGGGNDGSLDP